ncbi:MAG: hypothetical protein IH946_07155, partial [Bacteroidetes bacterium]|nr:hypothetical protein [Bacteroidota bacterium]
MVVNSDFNLQLSGMLTDDVEVVAAMTDNNIPIQPEGNTQQIQEFDKIFIRLKKDKSSLVMGDFEVPAPKGYFMRYFKKVKGGNIASSIKIGDKSKLNTSSGIAIARGRFNRMEFIGQEGNQGPYKLVGANQETFIIVVAGSERVYIDGHLLTRGLDHDYVINYNTGELTFTANRLITKDHRMVVDFEYSNQNFSRSLVFTNNTFSKKKIDLRFNVYSVQDHKNQPIQDLDPDRKKEISDALAKVGDNLQQAFISGVDTAEFTGNRIMYKMIDSLGYDSVFVHSNDPDSAIFTLSFTNLGPGNGNYEIARTDANGRVYRWLQPIAGESEGSFEPIIALVPPRTDQLLTTGLDYTLDK